MECKLGLSLHNKVAHTSQNVRDGLKLNEVVVSPKQETNS